MSCFEQSSLVNNGENLSEMKTCKSSVVKPASLTCGRCTMLYGDYKHLLEHLYWRHGTESSWCELCGLKRWSYAVHVCHVLPINDAEFEDEDSNIFYSERTSDYCFCGKYVEDSPMIGCDGARCALQWYHFECVGVVSPPDGKWLCPKCDKLKKARRKNKVIPVIIKNYRGLFLTTIKFFATEEGKICSHSGFIQFKLIKRYLGNASDFYL